jgi:Flp pilus assembly protein TadD
MLLKNINNIQCVTRRWLGCILMLAITSGCADALDQTNGDVNSSTEGMVYIGDQLHERGDDEGAVDFYTRALQRAPNDMAGHKHLGEILEAHGDNADAAEQYRVLVRLAPEDANFRCLYGRVLIKLNRPADAKEQYEAALQKNANDVKALNGLGVSLDLLQNHAAAQDAYKKALEQNSSDLVTLNNLGHSYVLAGEHDNAIKLLEPLAEKSGASPTLRENLAEAYVMAGMDADAERVLKMDMAPERTRNKIAAFHALRIKTAVNTTAVITTTTPTGPIYNDLGSFSTADLAQGRLERVKEKFAPIEQNVSLHVAAEVKDGMPIFFARADGFKTMGEAQAFCVKLRKGQFFCKPHEGNEPVDIGPMTDDQ